MKITLKIHPKTQADIDLLAKALGILAGSKTFTEPVKQVNEPVKQQSAATVKTEKVVKAEVKQETAAAEVTGDKIDPVVLFQAVEDNIKAGKRDAVKALLTKYGAKKTSDVKEADHAAFYADIKALA